MENRLFSDTNTIYSIASCTNPFTVAVCRILVDESKLSWTEPTQTSLPEFCTTNDVEVEKRPALMNLCSHGIGFAPVDHLSCGFHDEFGSAGMKNLKPPQFANLLRLEVSMTI